MLFEPILSQDSAQIALERPRTLCQNAHRMRQLISEGSSVLMHTRQSEDRCLLCGDAYERTREWREFCTGKCKREYHALAHKIGVMILKALDVATEKEIRTSDSRLRLVTQMCSLLLRSKVDGAQ